MLRMQEMAFPGFLFQKFSGEVCPHTLLFMRGMPATHVRGLRPLLSRFNK